MREVWLRTNRRALALGLLLPGIGLIALVAALVGSVVTRQHWLASAIIASLAVPLLWVIGGLCQAMNRPRIAYEPGIMILFLDFTRSIRVPIEIVECFFIGHGPSELPKLKGREPETRNIIIRLAETAIDWKHRDVRPAFGHWCDGYITVRGSWCETITPALVQLLNHRLSQVQRLAKSAEQSEIAP